MATDSHALGMDQSFGLTVAEGVVMRVTIAAFGLELDLTFGPADAPSPAPDTSSLDGGTTASTPIGYAPSYGDQRWQPGADHGAGEPEDREVP